MSNTTRKSSGEVRGVTSRSRNSSLKFPFWLSLLFFLFIASCNKDDYVAPGNEGLNDANAENLSLDKVRSAYEVTNLVANDSSYNPERVDPNLVNAWGIALSPTGIFWISAEGTDLSVVYRADGSQARGPVTMAGPPTGQVFNGTTGFVIPMLGPARFIFVTEDGKITAWNGPAGNVAPTIVDNSASGAAYTGSELAMDGEAAFLYVANVGGGTVDVFDQNWNQVMDKPFSDPTLPMGARPFNVQMIDGQMYVAYVGGGGVVNVFSTGGTFIKRFAEGSPLSGPWGLTNVPPEFGLGQAILVGNFGDGRINVYNKNGHFKGQLGDEDRNPITISGLWDLVFLPGAFDGTADLDLYFTAGPAGETDGIFGEIEHIEEELEE